MTTIFPFNYQYNTSNYFNNTKSIDKKNTQSYTITTNNDINTFNQYSKAIRISFMSNEIDKNKVYENISKIFLEGIEEPEYVSSNAELDEDTENYVIKSYFDKNDVLRKQIYTKLNGLPTSIEIFNEEGSLLYSASSNVNFYEPIVEFRKTYFDGSEDENVKEHKQFGIEIKKLS